jgi:hypothetical protein
MTAVVLATALPGQGSRRRIVLTTATPGLFLWRHRQACPHDAEDDDPRVCPGCEPWEWDVLPACGLTVARARPGEDFDRAQAAALAAGLGGTGVDWTVPDVVALLDQLTGGRLGAVVEVLRRYPVWVSADPAQGIAEQRDRYAAVAGSR